MKKKRTERQKKENLYGWFCGFLAVALFFICDVIINMAGVKFGSTRCLIDLGVVGVFIKLVSVAIDKHLDKKYGPEK